MYIYIYIYICLYIYMYIYIERERDRERERERQALLVKGLFEAKPSTLALNRLREMMFGELGLDSLNRRSLNPSLHHSCEFLGF